MGGWDPGSDAGQPQNGTGAGRCRVVSAALSWRRGSRAGPAPTVRPELFAGRARSHRARAAPTGFTFRTCTALSSTTRARSTSPERAGIKKPGQMEWLTGFKSISTRITGAALRTVRFATRRNECYADCRAAPCGTVSQSVRRQGPLPQSGPELFASRARSHRQCPLPQARACAHLSPAGCLPEFPRG
jgi:hypothetical protein